MSNESDSVNFNASQAQIRFFVIILGIVVFVSVVVGLVTIANRPGKVVTKQSDYNSLLELSLKFDVDYELLSRQVELTNYTAAKLSNLVKSKWFETLQHWSDRELGISLVISDCMMSLMTSNFVEGHGSRAISAIARQRLLGQNSQRMNSGPYRIPNSEISRVLTIAYTRKIPSINYSCTGIVEVPLVLKSVLSKYLPLGANPCQIGEASAIIDYLRCHGFTKLLGEFESGKGIGTIVDADGDYVAGSNSNLDLNSVYKAICSIEDSGEVGLLRSVMFNSNDTCYVLTQLYGGELIPRDSRMYIIV